MNGKQLKNSILQWAIQGKLVPQNPKDEPASKLLERIAAQRVIASGAKQSKKNLASRIYREGSSWFEQVGSAEPKDITEEIPFDIPESWEWCRLKNICSKFSTGPFGTMLHKEDYVENGGVPLVNPTNIKQGQIFASSIKQVNKAKYEVLSSFVLNENDIVIARRGDLSKCAVIGAFENGWLAGTGAFFLHLIFIEPNFFVKIYTSPYVQQYLIGDSVGTTMDNLNQSLLGNLLFPLPPVAEQERIIKKLEQILPLVDEYDQAQTQLDKLNKDLPETLKKSILQQAIQGKLVPQNLKDEPAQKLLERILKEKELLISQGALKKTENAVVDLPKEELERSYPDSWSVVKFRDVCLLSDGNKRQGKFICMDAKYLRGKSSGDFLESGKYVEKGSQIILVDGENSGEVFVAPVDGYMGSTFKQLWISSNLNREYVMYFLLNYKEVLRKSKRGAAIPHLNKELFYNLEFPVPPLAEQKRIVAKLEQLFKAL